MEASRKDEIMIKKANDHWAFLDHIEAPMWADLTLEAYSGGEDIHDDWFNTSHPFHQLSAQHLKSKFSYPGGEMLTSGLVDLQGPESPRLPSSVSRSRGKHYNIKKMGGMNLNVLLDKQQGLSRRFFQEGSTFGKEVKCKSKSNNLSRPKGPLSEKSNARGNAKSNWCNKVNRSSSLSNRSGESNTRSTITYESTQQQKDMEVSSKPCDLKNRSLTDRSVGLRKSCITNKALGFQKPQKCMMSSRLRVQKSETECSSVKSVSLGKSCVTKAASRVEIGRDGMPPRGRKSSSGNSSVGSSSIPGYEVKSVSKHLRERLVDGNNVITVNLANLSKWKPTSMSQESGTLTAAKLSKTKGKGNAAKNMILNPECTERGVSYGAMFKNHRIKGHCVLQKGDTARSAASTKLGKYKDQCEEKNSTNLARRIYLR